MTRTANTFRATDINAEIRRLGVFRVRNGLGDHQTLAMYSVADILPLLDKGHSATEILAILEEREKANPIPHGD
jgi:hypothetical protein